MPLLMVPLGCFAGHEGAAFGAFAYVVEGDDDGPAPPQDLHGRRSLGAGCSNPNTCHIPSMNTVGRSSCNQRTRRSAHGTGIVSSSRAPNCTRSVRVPKSRSLIGGLIPSFGAN